MSEHLIRTLAEAEAIKEDNKLKEQAWNNQPTGFFSILSVGKYFEDRDKWREAYTHGFTEGYVKALMTQPTRGVPVNLMDMSEKQEKFYDEFLKLAEKYKCQIEFHPQRGMVVSDLNPNNF